MYIRVHVAYATNAAMESPPSVAVDPKYHCWHLERLTAFSAARDQQFAVRA
jgi:hypothetical protein